MTGYEERTALLSRHFPAVKGWLRLPAFIGWLCLSAGIATGYYLLRRLHLPMILYDAAFPAAIFLSAAAGLLLAPIRARSVAFFIAGVAAAGLSVAGQQLEYGRARSFLSEAGHATLFGTVVTAPVMTKGAFVFLVRCDSLFAKNAGPVFRRKIIECRSTRTPCIAGAVTLDGRFVPARPAANPGSFDDYLYCMSRGVWGRFYCDSIISCAENPGAWPKLVQFARTTVLRAASHIRNSDYRAIITAAFLNDRSDISENMNVLFSRAGIYHLLALSGFNVAIVSAAFYALLLLVPVPRGLKALIIIGFVWMYLFFIGPIPSLFRAVVMTSVVSAALLFQRRPHLLNSLGIAGITWLLFSPLSLFTPGYQLSFSATAGLVMLSPVFMRMWKDAPDFACKKILSPLAAPLSVSCAAFLASAPVLAYHFGTLSLAGILVNLFAVFLMSLAMWISMLSFLLQVVFSPLVPFAMTAAEWCVGLMVAGAAALSNGPHPLSVLPRLYPPAYVLCAVFLLGLGAVRAAFVVRFFCVAGAVLAVLVVLLALWQRNATPSQLVFFQTGHSHCAGIRWPNREIWIVGLDGKGVSPNTYPHVIEPWLREMPGAGIGAVALAGEPCNSIQTIEPLLTENHIRSIFDFSCGASPCADFREFCREFGVACSTTTTKSIFSPCAGCSLLVEPCVPGEQNAAFGRCIVTVGRSSIAFSDSLVAPSEERGAAIVTFHAPKTPDIAYTIPDWHPLAAARNGEEGARYSR
jgi:ComEC/Rec2-related protein